MVSNVSVTGNSLREFYTSDWGKRLSRSGCQARVVHHLLVHVSANPARVRSKSLVSVSSWKICHILPFPLDSNGVVVRIVSFGLALSDSCSLIMTLSLMVVVSSWVTSSTIFACCSCRSALAFAAVLNSWNSVSCLESLVVLVHHVGVQRWVHTFLTLTLLLLLILQFFGIADVLSMHLFSFP